MITLRRTGVILLGLLVLAICAQARAEELSRRPWAYEDGFFNPTLWHDRVLQQWNEQHTPVQDWQGKLLDTPISSCKSLLTVAGAVHSVETKRSLPEDYHFCFPLSIYGRLRVPRRAWFDLKMIGRDINEHLDITTLPWRWARQAGPDHRPIANLPKGIAQLTDKPLGVVWYLDRQDTVYQPMFGINVLEAGDVLGSGDQQLVVEVDDRQKPDDSKFFDATYMLLTRETPSGAIVAKPLVLREPKF